MDFYTFEREAFSAGYGRVCGVDEAGAGPLAGPVYAAAVILPLDLELPYLNDSKQVTPRRRDALFDAIREQAVAWSVASVSEQEIDELDILNARIRAMELAMRAGPPADFALDGNRDHGSRCAIARPTAIVGGTGRAPHAAASILAKVSRDRYMEELDRIYPQYAFARHKGYGTRLHYQMLDAYGPCPAHRRSFLKKWEARR